MIVERIRKLDINNRPLFTGLYGYCFGQEYFVEDNLCKYSFRQELYRYLRSEGYTTLFYNAEFNFFSYEESQLETFFFKKPEEISKGQSQVHSTPHRFVAPINSPNGHNRRRGIRLSQNKTDNNQTSSNTLSTTTSLPEHDPNDKQLVSHRPNAILVKKIAGDQFFQLKRKEGVLSAFFDFVDKNPGHKIALVFTKPSDIFFPNMEQEWHTRLQTDYSQQRVSHLRHRIIVCYDVKNVRALHNSFDIENGFFFDKWFSDQIFPDYSDSRQDLEKPSNASFCVEGWGRDEVGNVLKRRRIKEGLNYTLSPIPFDDLCLRIWQQFRVKLPNHKGEKDIDTVMDMMGLPLKVLENQLKKMDNEKAMDKLKGLIGMESIVAQFERYLEDLRICRESGEKFRKHMVFMGNPGTGKTTVARIFADILREEGLLENGRLHSVTVGDLVSQYVGETRIKTQEMCQRARGGILFIDEAYGLFKSGSNDNGGATASNQFGEEAIEVLLQFMENDNNSLVIMAGYPTKMENLLKNGNAGLDSRIGEQGRFMFEDYNPEILLKIALAQLKDNNYTDQFKQKLHAIFTVLFRFRDKTWANARTAENTISKIKSNYRAKHLTGHFDVNAIPDDLIRLVRIPTEEEEKAFNRELDEMVGLRKVKDALKGIIASVKAKRIRDQIRQTKESDVRLNFVFRGNSGTGKTTVAEIIGKIFSSYGMVMSPKVIKYAKEQIVDGYVGGSARNVEMMFEECIGKVLFIDEAYQLADSKDALDTMTNMMTDPRYQDKLVMILAGYSGEMAEFINGNPGLKSRFTQYIDFEDYTNDELTTIFQRMITSEQFTISDEALKYAKTYFSSIKRNKNFGNAREAQNLLDRIKQRQAIRIQTGNFPVQDYFMYIPQDFPNYGKVNVDSNVVQEDPPLQPIDKLNKLIGVDGIRMQFDQYLRMARYCQLHPNAPISSSFRPHMAFLGNPGTGKTTVARLFAEILRVEGLLTSNNFVELGPDDFIGEYVGQSAPKARRQFERARGGVLFIDEAYELYKKGKDGGGNQYGQEVITALIKFMEDERDTIVILAGYTDEIRHLIKYGNPGLSSRITNEFTFDDYTPDVLFKILLKKLINYDLSEEFKKDMQQIIAYEYEHRMQKEWGNARTMENYAIEIFKNYLTLHNAEGKIESDCIPQHLQKDLIRDLVQQVKKSQQDIASIKPNLSDSLIIDLTLNPAEHRVSDTTMLKENATGLLYSSSGEGTGFIISLPERYILTCSHVIEGAGSELTFMMNCNKEFTTVAHVVWNNYENDLALLQVDELPEDACFVQLDNDVDSHPKELTELVLCGYPDGSAFASTPSLISGSINNFEKEHVWNDRCFDTIYANISATHGCSGGPVVRKSDMVLIGILQGGKEGGEIQFITDIHQLFKHLNIKQ